VRRELANDIHDGAKKIAPRPRASEARKAGQE
jgi:hypothetical protein